MLAENEIMIPLEEVMYLNTIHMVKELFKSKLAEKYPNIRLYDTRAKVYY